MKEQEKPKKKIGRRKEVEDGILFPSLIPRAFFPRMTKPWSKFIRDSITEKLEREGR